MKSKKEQKQDSAKTTPAEFIDGDGFLALRGEMYWKWRALDAGHTNAEELLF
jgi:hypothetical protein